MASVQPRRKSDGSISYRVQFRLNGKMTSKSFAHRQGAKQFGELVDRVGPAEAVATWEARQASGTDVPLFKEWIARYLDATSGLLTGIEPGTRAGYVAIAERGLNPILGELPIDAISQADIGRWVAWIEGQPSRRRTKGVPGRISPKTVKNYHALLSATLAAAVQSGLRKDNPAYKTALTRGRSREGVFLSADEFAVLLHFIPEPYKPLIEFLFGTGARWGEATALTWGDINFDTVVPTVRIDKAWKKGPDNKPVLGTTKTARSRRTIGIDHALAAALGAPQAGDQLVFPGLLSGRAIWYGSFNARIWKPAVARANDPVFCAAAGLTPIGKEPRLHDARHSHASWLIARGVPMPNVQRRLGHENITTTVNTYTHLAPDAHAEMATVIGDVMSNVLPRVEPATTGRTLEVLEAE